MGWGGEGGGARGWVFLSRVVGAERCIWGWRGAAASLATEDEDVYEVSVVRRGDASLSAMDR